MSETSGRGPRTANHTPETSKKERNNEKTKKKHFRGPVVWTFFFNASACNTRCRTATVALHIVYIYIYSM